MKFSLSNLIFNILTCHNIFNKKINNIKASLPLLEAVLKQQIVCICFKDHPMKMRGIIINQKR